MYAVKRLYSVLDMLRYQVHDKTTRKHTSSRLLGSALLLSRNWTTSRWRCSAAQTIGVQPPSS